MGSMFCRQSWRVSAFLAGTLVLVYCQARAEELFEHRFGPATEGEAAIERRYNPALEHIRLEPRGWIVDFQPRDEEPMPTGGFRTRFAAEGDFEATLHFKIGTIGKPPSGPGAGISLRTVFGEDDGAVSLSHLRVARDQLVVRAHVQAGPDAGGIQATDVTRSPRVLRIRRVDELMRFYSGRSARFLELVAEFQAPREPVSQVEVWATTGQTATPLKLQLESLQVKATALSAGRVADPEPPRLWPWIAGGLAALTVGLLVYRSYCNAA